MLFTTAVSMIVTISGVLYQGAAHDSGDYVKCLPPRLPSVILSGIPFEVKLDHHNPITDTDTDDDMKALPAFTLNNESIQTTLHSDVPLTHLIRVNNSGHATLCVTYTYNASRDICLPYCQDLMVIPSWTTVLPLVLTLLLALMLRQVVISLILGIWFTATLVSSYNPLTGAMITFSVYVVEALGTKANAAIFVFIMALGGLAGAIQKSGGLIKSFHCITASPRIVCTIVVVTSLSLFINEHALIMIAGNSFKSIVAEAGISKEKFAFILQTMAATMSSLVPISSWVGPQLGAIQSAINTLNITDQPFVILIKTLPYRYLQVLILACLLVLSLLNRDFGPMLNAEKKATTRLKTRKSSCNIESCDDVETQCRQQDVTQKDEITQTDHFPEGTLEPKPGSPQRCFNSAIPIVMLVLVTLGGMVYSGFDRINKSQMLANTPGTRLNFTAANVFASADVTSSLTWGAIAATILLFIMILLQRILSLTELMQAWMDGMKMTLNPVVVIMLSFALGNAVSELRTSDYIAQSLAEMNFHAQYMPALAAVLSYVVAYATTSAFGTMAILFPLTIPVAYKLTGDESLLIHTSAAILSSCTLGHLISPISDVTANVKDTAGCTLSSHQKSSVPYIVVMALLALVLGSLPVGAGWYPWYVGYFLMLGALVTIFIVFAAAHNEHSVSLFRRCCPCVYVAFDAMWKRLNLKSKASMWKKNIILKLKKSPARSTLSATNVMATMTEKTDFQSSINEDNLESQTHQETV